MLDAIHLFLKVVQVGSMSGAGKEVNLSPATVSRTIAHLEQHLGVQLFNRTSRSILLTDAGEKYHRSIKPLMAEMQDIESAARETQDVPEGLLRVHAHSSVGIHLVAPAIPAFHRLYPDITIDLQLSETPVNLLEEKYDVDVRLGALEDSSMLSRRIAPSDRVLVASPSYLARHPPINAPSDLLQHQCITFRPNSEATTWRFVRTGESLQEVKVKGPIHTNNSEVLRRVTVAGLGISVLTNWISQADRDAGRLVEILPDHRVTINSFNNGIFAVFRHTRFVPKKVRVFVDFLAAHGKVDAQFNWDN